MEETLICEKPPSTEVKSFMQCMHALNSSIAQQLSPALEQSLDLDLRLFFILHLIDDGKVFPSVIAQAMHLPNSLITKHLDQLAQKGQLERRIDSSDSRRIRLALTGEGRRAMEAADTTVTDVVAKRLARISDDRRRALIATLVELTQ